jgi:hypothetical protein
MVIVLSSSIRRDRRRLPPSFPGCAADGVEGAGPWCVRTCPATGPAIWRGGYNSGKTNSTNNLYLNTEGGINLVAMRSTQMPGTIRLTARREGLQPATISFDTKPVVVKDGLTQEMPQTLSPTAQAPLPAAPIRRP